MVMLLFTFQEILVDVDVETEPSTRLAIHEVAVEDSVAPVPSLFVNADAVYSSFVEEDFTRAV